MALEQPVLRPSFLWIGDLQDLTIFTIGSNNFTGTLPTELEQLVKLTDLILIVNSNQFTGSLLTELGKLND
jgi:hypothetical protein